MDGSPETGTPATELELWWRDNRAALKLARLEREAEDPGVPAYYGTCTGGTTPHPWSAVAGCREPPRKVLNLDKLRRRVMELIGMPV